MIYQEYVSKNKEIQNKFLLFLDKEDDVEENYNNLLELITRYKIIDDPHKLKSLLNLISNIANNHYQTPSFFFKIEQLLEYLKESIKNNFTNQKIFDIFKSNKAILLILIEREIMIFDETILSIILTKKYFKKTFCQFFSPEIRQIIEKNKNKMKNDETNSNDENSEYEYNKEEEEEEEENDSYENDDAKIDFDENLRKYISDDLYFNRDFINFYEQFSNKLPENFFEQRKIGQNENYICKLIREDLIDEFITYVNKNDYPLNSYIEKSIYETNDFLNEQNKTKLIEYASFFGSAQIFKYLYKNGVELTSKLWLYGIHSDNSEIIQLLEENEVKPPKESYLKCIKESIKCHHNDITNYILSNFIKEDIENIDQINFEEKYNENIYSYSFHYYNFSYFPTEIEHKVIFYYACEYDYIEIVEYFIKKKKIDIKTKIIYNLNSSNFKLSIFIIFLQ